MALKPSGIGGQAVLEGIMMRNRDRYAVAVRKPDGTIAVDFHMDQIPAWRRRVNKIPIVRGVVSFVSSLVVGMRTLTYSASFFEDEEAPDGKDGAAGGSAAADEASVSASDEAAKTRTAAAQEPAGDTGKVQDSEAGDAFTPLEIGLTVVLAIVLAVGIFMILPYGLSLLVGIVVKNVTLLALIEGVLRLLIFLIYVWAISLMEDIKRTYMYHGSEHKCINCIESGLPLTVENVRRSSRFHKRCGTSFLLVVMVISIVIFSLIRAHSPLLRLVYRLLLIPVVAGVSYEFLQWAGRSENAVVNLLSAPGLCLQRLTTKEPTDDMIEVAITAVERVFDWQAFLDGKEADQCFPVKRTYLDCLKDARKKMEEAGVPDARHDAEALLLYVTGLTHTQYLTRRTKEMPRPQQEHYADLTRRRTRRIPLQHLTGVQGFYGLDFTVDETVLIPRPETECLVEEAIAVCRAMQPREASGEDENVLRGQGPRDTREDPACLDVLDLCTGSGCILISLLHELKGQVRIRATGTDLSEDALNTAAENARRLLDEEEITWVRSDLFAQVEGPFDLILSNPPYIKREEIGTLEPEVRDHDPRMALDGGEDGLDFYRVIARESPRYLKRGGRLILEIGADQAEDVRALLKDAGYAKIAVRQDLAGRDRVICAVRTPQV